MHNLKTIKEILEALVNYTLMDDAEYWDFLDNYDGCVPCDGVSQEEFETRKKAFENNSSPEHIRNLALVSAGHIYCTALRAQELLETPSAPSKPKVIVTVEGGIVQDVTGSVDLEVVVIDIDKHAEDRVTAAHYESSGDDFPVVVDNFENLINSYNDCMRKEDAERVQDVLAALREDIEQ